MPNLWTKEQVKLGFNLYCQLPFGKLHKGNPEIIELAKLIGRTPSAVAMKLCNLVSIDQEIRPTRRNTKGLCAIAVLTGHQRLNRTSDRWPPDPDYEKPICVRRSDSLE